MVTEYLDPVGGKRPKRTHIFDKEDGLHYVEPEWCSIRLFEAERFPGPILDPFAGWGRVVKAARAAGYATIAADIACRGFPLDRTQDFLTVDRLDPEVSICGNPPFRDHILQHVIALNPVKAALLWPLARLVAACDWLGCAPLARVLMLTPRPPMPPASYIAAGKKPEGARVEHCWLIFECGYRGPVHLGWLHRDGEAA